MMNKILDWLLPRDFRTYWSLWFIFLYVSIGIIIHAPGVARSFFWPFIMLKELIR